MDFEVNLFQGGSRLARSRGNVNISDRFIGPTDLLGLGHPTIFQGATHQITSPKAWQPQDYIPNSTRQQGILPPDYISQSGAQQTIL